MADKTPETEIVPDVTEPEEAVVAPVAAPVVKDQIEGYADFVRSVHEKAAADTTEATPV